MDQRDVYIAGPLFTPSEREYLEAIAALCSRLGLSSYLPHRDAGFGPVRDGRGKYFFEQDLSMLQESLCMIAVVDGPDVDSGTAWEIGFAYAVGKYIIGIRQDIRDGEINPMLNCTLTLTRSLKELCEVLTDWRKVCDKQHG